MLGFLSVDLSTFLLIAFEPRRLIDEERLKAIEAQRKTILNLNASGAVARLLLEAKERRRPQQAGTEHVSGFLFVCRVCLLVRLFSLSTPLLWHSFRLFCLMDALALLLCLH